MAPPLLVVEVVSPGNLQRDRDYVAKRQQYQDLAIPEYWIVDPQRQTVVVLELAADLYPEANTFQGSDQLGSSQFRALDLTAAQLFNREEAGPE